MIFKIFADEPNPYNYSIESLREKYNYLLPDTTESSTSLTSLSTASPSRLFIFRLRRNHPSESLGLSLSGNVNLNKTSVFVCAIYKNSIAHRHGLIHVGDQILEINGQVIYGRAHSNVTPMIRNMKDLDVYLVVLRLESKSLSLFLSLDLDYILEVIMMIFANCRSADNLNQMYKPTYQQINSRSGSSSPPSSSATPDLSYNNNQSSLSVHAPLAHSTNSTQSICCRDGGATQSAADHTTSNSSLPHTTGGGGGGGGGTLSSGTGSGSNRTIRKIVLKKVRNKPKNVFQSLLK